jgi:hypothetical protein
MVTQVLGFSPFAPWIPVSIRLYNARLVLVVFAWMVLLILAVVVSIELGSKVGCNIATTSSLSPSICQCIVYKALIKLSRPDPSLSDSLANLERL